MNLSDRLRLVPMTRTQKRQYHDVEARLAQLPGDYRAASRALERHLVFVGFVSTWSERIDVATRVVELFEIAANEGAPLHRIIGRDPVELVETLLRASAPSRRLLDERERLARSVREATAPTSSRRRPWSGTPPLAAPLELVSYSLRPPSK